jgi:putative membrane protein
MRNFLLRLIINAIAIAVTAEILPGISVRDNGLGTLLIVAFIFGLANAVLKPLLTILTCPFIILSLGLFLLVINGAMLLITDALSGGRFEVDGWGTAILGGIIMGLIGMVLEGVLGVKDDEDKKKRQRGDDGGPFVIQG